MLPSKMHENLPAVLCFFLSLLYWYVCSPWQCPTAQTLKKKELTLYTFQWKLMLCYAFLFIRFLRGLTLSKSNSSKFTHSSTCYVLQSSVLGPTLFNLYVRDITKDVVDKVNFLLLTQRWTIVLIDNNIPYVDLALLKDWSKQWKL